MEIMKTSLLTLLISVLLSPIKATSESSDEEFDFRTTMAIYHMVEGGGHIYVRPREYFNRHGFIIIYEALDQYIVELGNPDNQRFMDPGSQPVLDEFVLVNDVSQKSYFLKEYWLGDGENWVPMSRSDYNNLRSMVDGRRASGSRPSSADGLEKYAKEIHERSAYNDYSGYEWEGNNVRQEDFWWDEAGGESAATAPIESSEERAHELVETLPQKERAPQDEEASANDLSSDRQRDLPESTSIAEEPRAATQRAAVETRERIPGIQRVQEREQHSGRVWIWIWIWIWIAILSILLLGGFLYIRKKP